MEAGFKIAFGQLLIKRLALFMGLCYLIGPLHQPLNAVLHEIVSSFESPNQVIGHHADIDDNEIALRTGHDHDMMEIQPGHSLVDFINMIFENSEKDKNSDQSKPDKLEIDKHLTTSAQFLNHNVKPISGVANWMVHLGLKKGHPIKWEEPPQSS